MTSLIRRLCTSHQGTEAYNAADSSTWPSMIKMQGLPFIHRGWNKGFYWTGEFNEEQPVYRLNPYIRYCYIRVSGAQILMHKGKWILRRNSDPIGCTSISKIYNENSKLPDQDGPEGKWSHGGKVTEYNDPTTHLPLTP